MAFGNLPILLLGSLTVAVPIALHLIMRQQPKRQVFPAIRFLQKRQSVNTRKLRVRQWVLLALRCLALVLLAATLARPSVASTLFSNWTVAGITAILALIALVLTVAGYAANRGKMLTGLLALIAMVLSGVCFYSTGKAIRDSSNVLLGDRESPIAAAIVIDNSPRMGYVFENEDRLERSKRIADWLIRQFPSDSQVGVLDARAGRGVFAADIGAAVSSLSTLVQQNLTQSMPSKIRDAIDLLAESKKDRKELYLFTDLTRASWKDESIDVHALLRDYPSLELYVVDVGVERPTNISISECRLSSEILTLNSGLKIDVKLDQIGNSQSNNVALYLEDANQPPPITVDGKSEEPQARIRGRRPVQIPDDSSEWVSFQLSGLKMGVHHGYVELDSNDALGIDNRRAFTVAVRKPWPILVVKGPNAVPFVSQQLAPLSLRETGRAKYEFTVVDEEPNKRDLGSQKLDKFAAVCLLDPPPLYSADWQSLERFAKRGGGIAIFLGRNAKDMAKTANREKLELNSSAALNVLPGPIQRQFRSPEGIYLSPTNYSHPILQRIKSFTSTFPWETMPIFKHHTFGELHENAAVIMNFGNNKPALIERVIGLGQVVIMSTPISDRDSADRPWNYLPLGEDSTTVWPFMMLADQILSHVIQSETSSLNYLSGEAASMIVDNVGHAQRFQLYSPRGDWQEVSANSGRVNVSFTESLGSYRLYSEDKLALGGFSVNLPPQKTNLERMERTDLDQLLGKDQYHLVKEQEEIVREVDTGRVGREFYPFLLVTLVVVLAFENLLSNRFYRSN